MTTLEFSNEFDIQYNGIATNSAPPLDLFEKSVYLSRAQLQIVNNYFNPNGNKYKDGFEQSSKRRNDLSELIKSDASTTTISSSAGLSDNSQFFVILDDVYMIIQEQAKLSSTDTCINGTYAEVIPKTHDEYNNQKNNPWKAPNKSKVWRIDFSRQSGSRNVELITPYTIEEYKYRYIEFPNPIILTDLDTAFPGENLSIDGISTEQTCSLNESIHRDILSRAVDLATADYEKNDKVAIRTQMSSRDE